MEIYVFPPSIKRTSCSLKVLDWQPWRLKSCVYPENQPSMGKLRPSGAAWAVVTCWEMHPFPSQLQLWWPDPTREASVQASSDHAFILLRNFFGPKKTTPGATSGACAVSRITSSSSLSLCTHRTEHVFDEPQVKIQSLPWKISGRKRWLTEHIHPENLKRLLVFPLLVLITGVFVLHN